MKNSKNLRISQCMIVKNEEKNIEKALSWGKGIVAEQIVVDTGSTDRTVEIAKAMGAQVYYFQWIDDFAAAKNFAIEKARYEWMRMNISQKRMQGSFPLLSGGPRRTDAMGLQPDGSNWMTRAGLHRRTPRYVSFAMALRYGINGGSMNICQQTIIRQL